MITSEERNWRTWSGVWQCPPYQYFCPTKTVFSFRSCRYCTFKPTRQMQVSLWSAFNTVPHYCSDREVAGVIRRSSPFSRFLLHSPNYLFPYFYCLSITSEVDTQKNVPWPKSLFWFCWDKQARGQIAQRINVPGIALMLLVTRWLPTTWGSFFLLFLLWLES